MPKRSSRNRVDNVDGLMLRSIAQSLESIARDYHEWVEIQKRYQGPHKGQPSIIKIGQARYRDRDRDGDNQYSTGQGSTGDGMEAEAEVPGFRRR